MIFSLQSYSQDTTIISEELSLRAGMNGPGSKVSLKAGYAEIDIGWHLSLSYSVKFRKGGLRSTLYYHRNNVNDEFLIEHNEGSIQAIESGKYSGFGMLIGPQFTFPDTKKTQIQLSFQGGGFVASLPEQTFYYTSNPIDVKSSGTSPGFVLAASVDFIFFPKQTFGFSFSTSVLREYANIPRESDNNDESPYRWDYIYPEIKVGFLLKL